jgi:hypothetical protein
VFVPFGVEITGGLGKEARAFYKQCLEWANGHNDVDSCHWIANCVGVGTRRAVGNKIHAAYRIVDAAYNTGAPYTDAA